MITIKELTIPDVKLLIPHSHHDDRGHLTEVYKEEAMKQHGLPHLFPQENQSLSINANTIRGMHAQKPPVAQGKLVRVLRGSIFDVAIDIRPRSPTFGQYVGIKLSDQETTQMYIPPGFLHGFCTLEDNTVVHYKLTHAYVPGSEVGILWNDPTLKINWPLRSSKVYISDKDGQLPLLKNFSKEEWL